MSPNAIIVLIVGGILLLGLISCWISLSVVGKRTTAQWAHLAPVIGGTIKPGLLRGPSVAGSYRGMPVTLRLGADKTYVGPNYYDVLYFLVIVLDTGSRGGNWKCNYGAEKLLALNDHHWHLLADEPLKDRLAAAGVVDQIQQCNPRDKLFYHGSTGRLAYWKLAEGLKSLGSPEELSEALGFLAVLGEANRMANA